MKEENNLILNKLFTKKIINNLINKEEKIYHYAINRFLPNIKNKKNNEVIKEIYNYMSKEYRNEYFYKNTIFNKVLLGRHSLNTTIALTEIPISKSKADFILINGKAMVYEIKTELDTLDRLNNQLKDYYKVFTYVTVLTCEKNYNKVFEQLKDSKIGISILTNRNTISIKKKAEEEKNFLEYKTIFKFLRKNEFEEIILKNIGHLPKASEFKYYSECLKLFEEIDVNIIYKDMIKVLKKRVKIEDFYLKFNIPYELKSLIYFSKYKEEDYEKLERFLNNYYEGD